MITDINELLRELTSIQIEFEGHHSKVDYMLIEDFCACKGACTCDWFGIMVPSGNEMPCQSDSDLKWLHERLLRREQLLEELVLAWKLRS